MPEGAAVRSFPARNLPMNTADRRFPRLTPRRLARGAWRGLLLVLGVVAFVASVKCFLEPAHLLSGGVTGAGLLMQSLLHVPVGLGMALLSVPIFLVAFRGVGRAFAALSALAVILSWIAADYLAFPPLTKDPMLAAIFGGALVGVGSAVALKSSGSLGGFDILGVYVSRRFGVGVGEALLALNGGLVVATALISSAELAMYTLLGIVATSWALDAIQAPRPRRAFLVMTRRPGPIQDRVLRQMGHGATVFDARGAYTGQEVTVLLCIVSRQETSELADIVREEDPDAFVAVLAAPEVFGRFHTPSAGAMLRRLAAKPAVPGEEA